jgi:hypothetical protein
MKQRRQDSAIFCFVAAKTVLCEAGPVEAPKQKYKWPWFVLAFVLLGFVLAAIWITLAAKKIEQQRDYNAPLPTTAPSR